MDPEPGRMVVDGALAGDPVASAAASHEAAVVGAVGEPVPEHSHLDPAAALHRQHAAREGGAAAASMLRRAGCRATPQRLLVLQALGGGEHITAEEILAHARERYPTANASTVYRTLEALVGAGLVRQNDLGAGRLHYELAREHRHHHAVCERCGAVAHLHDSLLAPLARALAAAVGHRLSPDRELTLPTLCPTCQAVPAGDAPTTHDHDHPPGKESHAHP